MFVGPADCQCQEGRPPDLPDYYWKLLEVRVGAGSMVGDIDYLGDFGH